MPFHDFIEPNRQKQIKHWPNWYRPPTHNTQPFLIRASEILGCSIHEIRTKSRKHHYSHRRFAIAHIMRDRLGYSYPQIGRAIGLSDHTSAMHAVTASRSLVKRNREHRDMVYTLGLVA